MTSVQTTNLPSLNSLRFLAACSVFLAHGALEMVFANQMIAGLFGFTIIPVAFSAVSYFFILSGFVLTWSHRPEQSARTFWRRRTFRIFPNHLVAVVIAFVLMTLAGLSTGVPQALAQLLLVHAWVPDASYYNNLNGVSWSLSVEAFCYVLFPLLLVVVFKKIKVNHLWYWLIGAMLAVIALPVLAKLFLPDAPPHPLSQMNLASFISAVMNPDQTAGGLSNGSVAQNWFVYHFPVARALEFFIGMLLARIVANGRWINLRPRRAMLFLCLAYFVALFTPYLFQLTAVTIIPLTLLVGAVGASDAHGRRTFLHKSWLVRLGDLTFAFYLVHNLVLVYGHLAFGKVETEDGLQGRSWSAPLALAFLAGAFVVSLALAWLLYTFVERPTSRRWSRPKPSPRPTQPVEPVEPAAAEPPAEPAVEPAAVRPGAS